MITKLLVQCTDELLTPVPKHILPLLSGIMTAPFATAYPPLLLAATRAYQAVTLNGWPRLADHRAEILEGLLMCWSRIHDEKTSNPDLVAVQTQVEATVKLLALALKDAIDVIGEFKELTYADPNLRELRIA